MLMANKRMYSQDTTPTLKIKIALVNFFYYNNSTQYEEKICWKLKKKIDGGRRSSMNNVQIEEV